MSNFRKVYIQVFIKYRSLRLRCQYFIKNLFIVKLKTEEKVKKNFNINLKKFKYINKNSLT